LNGCSPRLQSERPTVEGGHNVPQHLVQFGAAMSVALAAIAIVVLLVLIVVSMTMRHGTRAAERKESDIRSSAGDAQHADSLRRRAEARAAPSERSGPVASHTDE
jgi:hypothetical protein